MKKNYSTPKLNIYPVNLANVIATSGEQQQAQSSTESLKETNFIWN